MEKNINLNFSNFILQKDPFLNEGFFDLSKKIGSAIGGAIRGYSTGGTYKELAEAEEQFFYLIEIALRNFSTNIENIEYIDADGEKKKYNKKISQFIYNKLKNEYKNVIKKIYTQGRLINVSKLKKSPKRLSPEVEIIDPKAPPPTPQQTTQPVGGLVSPEEKSRIEYEEEIKAETKRISENLINNFNNFADYMFKELGTPSEEGDKPFYSNKDFPLSTLLAISKVYKFYPLVLNKSFEELKRSKSEKWADLITNINNIFFENSCRFDNNEYVEELKQCVENFEKKYSINTIKELGYNYKIWRNLIRALREIAKKIDEFCENNSKDICVVKGNKGGHNLHINLESNKNISFSTWILMRESN